MLVIPEEGTDFCNHVNQEEGKNRRKVEGEAVYTAPGDETQTTSCCCRRKTLLTFLGHVVHAVGHRRALLLGVQGGEASVVVHKVVVCKKKNNITIKNAGRAVSSPSIGINCVFIPQTNKQKGMKEVRSEIRYANVAVFVLKVKKQNKVVCLRSGRTMWTPRAQSELWEQI